MRRLLRATPLVVEGKRSWWGEQYVGIDLHRRRSVIVRMTGAGGVLETIRDHNDTFPVKTSAQEPRQWDHAPAP
jgi:hypothetical protein